MKRGFATMREIVGGNELEDRRDRFRRRQVSGRVVMIDRRCPYDPADGIVMMLVATAAGSLVRAPLTTVEVKALVDFAMAEGEPMARGMAEMLALRERVADLERQLEEARNGEAH